MLTVESVEKHLRAKKGNVTAAAKSLKCYRSGLQQFIGNHPELQAVLAEARETMVDAAEDSLGRLVRDRHFAAVKYVLDGWGASRGHGDAALVKEVESLRAMLNQLLMQVAALGKPNGDGATAQGASGHPGVNGAGGPGTGGPRDPGSPLPG